MELMAGAANPVVTNIGANFMHNRRCKWSEVTLYF